MKEEHRGEIYIITSPCSKQYIGQTTTLAQRKDKFIKWGYIQRWRQHVNEANSKTKEGCVKLNAYINKYGANNFKVELILVCDKNDLNYFETRMIKEYNSLSPGGLNLKSGSFEKVVFSEETKLKMSNSAKGRTFTEETIEKIRQGNLGKVVSDETREKLRKANTGFVVSDETKLKISEFQKDYLQPKRKHFGLPDYIYRINYTKKQGFVVKNHKDLKIKYFVSNSLSMEQKLHLAKQYLNEIQKD